MSEDGTDGTDALDLGPSDDWSGIRSGPLVAGERVSLFDQKGRRHSIKLTSGATYHTTKGGINHDELIGGPDGVVITSAKGITYLALRPLLEEYTGIPLPFPKLDIVTVPHLFGAMENPGLVTFQQAIVFALLIAVMLVRPSGLLGRAAVQKV